MRTLVSRSSFVAATGRRSAQAIALVLVSLSITAGAGQITQPTPPGYNGTHNGSDPLANAPNPMAGSSAARLERFREDERRKRLAADTAKLVELTNQLKEEVDKASKDELSLDVVRKAAEIEKLAHDVKERMKS